MNHRPSHPKPAIYSIYCHTCLVSGKKYVGQTRMSVQKRWRGHVYAARTRKDDGCPVFMAAIRKYGEHAFVSELLETVGTRDEANAAETKWIGWLNTLVNDGYNIERGGGAREMSEWTRTKMKATKGSPANVQAARARSLEIVAATPRHVQLEWAARARAQQTPEKLSDRGRRSNAEWTRSKRSLAKQAFWASKTPEERSAIAKTRLAKHPDAAKRGAQARWAATTAEEREMHGRRVAAAITDEGRASISRAKKAWHARRRTLRLVLDIAARPVVEPIGYGC